MWGSSILYQCSLRIKVEPVNVMEMEISITGIKTSLCASFSHDSMALIAEFMFDSGVDIK